MAVAYATIANGGRVVRPHLGAEVEDADGRAAAAASSPPARRRVAIDPSGAQRDPRRPARGGHGRRHLVGRLQRLDQAASRSSARPARPSAPARPTSPGTCLRARREQADRPRRHRRAGRLRRRGRRPGGPLHARRWFNQKRSLQRQSPRSPRLTDGLAAAPSARRRRRARASRPAPRRWPAPAVRPGAAARRRSGCAPCSLMTIALRDGGDIAGNPHYYVDRQAVYFGVGLVADAACARRLLAAARAEVRHLRPCSGSASWPSRRSAPSTRGSRRAIELPFFEVQSSELGKVLLVVALAGFLVDRVAAACTAGTRPPASCC